MSNYPLQGNNNSNNNTNNIQNSESQNNQNIEMKDAYNNLSNMNNMMVNNTMNNNNMNNNMSNNAIPFYNSNLNNNNNSSLNTNQVTQPQSQPLNQVQSHLIIQKNEIKNSLSDDSKNTASFIKNYTPTLQTFDYYKNLNSTPKSNNINTIEEIKRSNNSSDNSRSQDLFDFNNKCFVEKANENFNQSIYTL